MKRNAKRERWMSLFESTVISLEPRFAGRIPWEAASFHFNEGTSPGLAAFRVIKSEQPTGDAFPAGATVKPNEETSQ